MTTAPKPLKNWKQITACFNEEERLIFQTRIGILCGSAEPSPESAAWAIEEVRRWQLSQKERK